MSVGDPANVSVPGTSLQPLPPGGRSPHSRWVTSEPGSLGQPAGTVLGITGAGDGIPGFEPAGADLGIELPVPYLPLPSASVPW